MKKLVMTFLALSTTMSHAGLLVEPYLGYRLGDLEYTVANSGTSNGEYDYDSKGYEIGGRLGYTFLGLMAGLDAAVGSIDMDAGSFPSNAAVPGEFEFDTSHIGIFAGYEFPILLRAWATYYINNEWEVSNGPTAASNNDAYSGSGYALGAGFTGLPFISLNLEYRSYTFDQIDNYGSPESEVNLPTAQLSEYDVKEIMLSVSAPFDFF